MGQNTDQPRRAYPPFWIRLSILQGNLCQIAGLVIGAGLIYLAAHLPTSWLAQLSLLMIGNFLIYICCHSLAHWLVGRLVGIRFIGYGIRGTNHPDDLSPFMRRILTRIPMFTALTEKTSMRQASPLARALMFAAGETSTIICLLLVAFYAWLNGLPGGILWPIIATLMSISAAYSTATMPTGDYAKAIKALKQ